jgi:hypothetical protein
MALIWKVQLFMYLFMKKKFPKTFAGSGLFGYFYNCEMTLSTVSMIPPEKWF